MVKLLVNLEMSITDFDDSNSLNEISTEVTVRNPVTHFSCGNCRYTDYEIALKSNDFCFSFSQSVVHRTFAEFVSLRHLLKVLNPNVSPPALPSASFFSDHFNEQFIERRRQHLENFLQQVLMQPLYLSNKALHLFLQSKLSVKEIEAQVYGEFPVIPFGDDDSQTVFADSSMSGSSVGSDCLDSDRTDYCIPNEKSACLLSPNLEAFVTLPFVACSANFTKGISKSERSRSRHSSSQLSTSDDSYEAKSLIK